MNGLSIGFIARDWSPRAGRGRELREIELREISLVKSPMLPGATFAVAGRTPISVRGGNAEGLRRTM